MNCRCRPDAIDALLLISDASHLQRNRSEKRMGVGLIQSEKID